jgi:ABC-type sugar transport system ATPase subunit
MNFLQGRLLQEGTRLFFDEGTAKLPVPSWAVPELSARSGEEIVLGVRPEALSDQAHARFPTTDNHITMRVTLVQPLGDRMDVYLATERHPRAVAQIQAHTAIRPGDTLPVYFDPSRVHFFEPGEIGRRIVDVPAASRVSVPVTPRAIGHAASHG